MFAAGKYDRIERAPALNSVWPILIHERSNRTNGSSRYLYLEDETLERTRVSVLIAIVSRHVDVCEERFCSVTCGRYYTESSFNVAIDNSSSSDEVETLRIRPFGRLDKIR
jgi:hypothetical protein